MNSKILQINNRIKPSSTPVFIVSRDRLSTLEALVQWLESTGFQRIIIVDNASTYEPLRSYLKSSPHTVLWMKENLGPHKALWDSGVIGRMAFGQRYIVTDNDVVPDSQCPPDVVDLLSWIVDRYPQYVKAGLGLRIDDLPNSFRWRESVISWEERFWQRKLQAGLFHAPIDTTFALYREDGLFRYDPAIRTGWPYVAQHLPWYSDSANLSAEEIYYITNCRKDINNWDSGQIINPVLPVRKVTNRVRWTFHRYLGVRRDTGINPKFGREAFRQTKFQAR